MDLRYYGRVVSRFRWLVIGGVILALVLGFLSFAKVSSKGITYRDTETYQSTATMLLTQGGKTFADPTKFSGLTDLYSALANSDQVRATMLRDGANKSWKVTAVPVSPASNPEAILPVIQLTGVADSAADAVKATQIGTRAFLDVVSRQPGAATLEVLQQPTNPIVIVPRKKTLMIVVILAVLSATFGLALVLENLRPRGMVASTATDVRKGGGPLQPAATRAAS